MPGESIRNLLERFGSDRCTPEEMAALERWYNELTVANTPWLQEQESVEAQTLTEDMLLQFRQLLQQHEQSVRAVNRRRLYYRFAAAAAIVLLAGTVVFYLITSSDSRKQTVAHTTNTHELPDILPGGNHALLMLADGSSVVLDTAQQGWQLQQGISTVVKTNDGALVYKSNSAAGTATAPINTVRTPRGGQYQVQLPDGSKVWLNAASSVSFPVQFAANRRTISVSGEVYIEAVRNSVPFEVNILNGAGNRLGRVEVMGTSFNINAYDDEGKVRTTLVEGKVKVTGNAADGSAHSGVLLPGQQATIINNVLTIAEEADVEEAVAWKNGLFRFNDADLYTILRQAARWYDIEIAYEGAGINDRFRGSISRNVTLSEFLRILEINQVSFIQEGKKIIIQ